MRHAPESGGSFFPPCALGCDRTLSFRKEEFFMSTKLFTCGLRAAARPSFRRGGIGHGC